MPTRLEVARRIAARFAALPEVEAVAMAGSASAGRDDDGSDIDLYVHARAEPALATRAAIAAGSPRAELGNRIYEPGDEWIDAESGAHVDVMYRDPRWIEDELDRVLVRHEARVGYSTAFWAGVRQSVPLFDRAGWYARLLESARRPYPDALVRSIVAKNQPLLRRNLSSLRVQLERAVARRDHVSANHRTAAFLASFFDVLFALNRIPHPGEKRLVAIAEAACPLRPPDLAARVEALLAAAGAPGPDLVARADALGEELDRLLRQAGLLA